MCDSPKELIRIASLEEHTLNISIGVAETGYLAILYGR